MRLPRFRVRTLMIVVAVVAIDIAIARTIYGWSPKYLIAPALPVVFLQGATFLRFRTGGPHSAFWLGFIGFGGMFTVGSICAMLFPGGYGILHGRSHTMLPCFSGSLARTPDAPLYPVLHRYFELTGGKVAPLLFDLKAGINGGVDPNGVRFITFNALVWSLPQFVVALLGGLFVWSISRISRPRNSTVGPEQPSLTHAQSA